MYDIHHIVEQAQAGQDGFSREVIDDPNNLARVPRLKHQQINGWYQTKNDEYGGLSPRDYLEGRSWAVRRSVGLDALRQFKVLKPKRPNLASMSVAQLVERFGAICVEQYKHLRHDEIERYNQSFDDLVAIKDELKARPGDRRNALLPLLGHQNPQVRLMAAEFTLSIAQNAARQTLQEIWDRKEFPQAAQAMGTLRALDRGDRVPEQQDAILSRPRTLRRRACLR